MSQPQRMYRAFFNFGSLSMWHPESPAPHFHSEGELSPCGQFIETRYQSMDKQRVETHREDVSRYWQPTRAKALAAVSDRLRAIGQRLIDQADEHERMALQETNRPALAAVAATSGDMGRPAEGGE